MPALLWLPRHLGPDDATAVRSGHWPERPPGGACWAYVGFRIPQILNPVGARGSTDAPDRVRALLDTAFRDQVRAIGTQWDPDGGRTLELRHVWRAGEQKVHSFLLARTLGESPEQAACGAERLADHLAANLASTMTLDVIEDTDVLLGALVPFPVKYCAQIRPVIASMPMGARGSALVPCPMRGEAEGLRGPLAALTSLKDDAALSVAIRPTQLDDDERSAIETSSRQAAEFADRRDAYSNGGQGQQKSVTSQKVADRFMKLGGSLSQPFQIRALVVTAADSPLAVANALVADASRPNTEKGGDDWPAPTAEVIAQPDGVDDFVQLRLRSARHAGVPPALERLAHLQDAQGAATWWRLPLPPREGLRGFVVREPDIFARVEPGSPSDPEPTLRLGHAPGGGDIRMPVADLSRHAMIVGTTGSGKTTTALELLRQLWVDHHIPFMVIEPVNSEHDDYRRLFGQPEFADGLIFTVGDESTSPFRLNPFEAQDGVAVTEHVATLMQALKAALPMWEPLPRIFQKAILRAYDNRGWDAFERVGQHERDFPTFWDFIHALDDVVDHEVEHGGEVASNIRGASKLRMESLLLSPLGPTLTARRSYPVAELLDRPVLFELRHVGAGDDKALFIALLVSSLIEHFDRNRPIGSAFAHLIVLEEAHILLAKAEKGGSPDQGVSSKAEAVDAFARALAEIRKYGEGIMVLEQIPSKLATEVVKNTNLKIVHRLLAKEDRELVGATMSLDAEQEAALASLSKGEAVGIFEPLRHGARVDIDPPAFAADAQLADGAIASRMRGGLQDRPEIWLPFEGCGACAGQCAYRGRGQGLAQRAAVRHGVDAAFARIPDEGQTAFWVALKDVIRDTAEHHGDDVGGVAWCAALHLRATDPQLRLVPTAEFAGRLMTASNEPANRLLDRGTEQ